jgi:hypothetical protein
MRVSMYRGFVCEGFCEQGFLCAKGTLAYRSDYVDRAQVLEYTPGTSAEPERHCILSCPGSVVGSSGDAAFAMLTKPKIISATAAVATTGKNSRELFVIGKIVRG